MKTDFLNSFTKLLSQKTEVPSSQKLYNPHTSYGKESTHAAGHVAALPSGECSHTGPCRSANSQPFSGLGPKFAGFMGGL